MHIEGKGHSESQAAAAHLRAATERGYRVRKFYGDGAYDTHDIFAALHSTDTEPVVKIRKGASASHRHSPRHSNKYRPE